MNKSRIVGSLLLVFVLCGSLSCRSWCNRWSAGGGADEKLVASRDAPAAIATPSEPVPQVRPFSAQRPAPVKPVAELPAAVNAVKPKAATSEGNSHIVSRTYPCAECGIIRVDKSMPEQVEPNRPFDYVIKFTNLTDMALPGVVITEDIPENFKLINSIPTARNLVKRLVWEVDLLEPKASKQITVSGVAMEGGFLKYCTTVVTQVIPACASVKVIQPKLELLMVAPAEAVSCDPIPVKFAVANSGTGDVQNVKLVDTLPAGLQTSDGKNEIVFDVGMLTPGQSRQFSSELKVVKNGKYVCQAVASSPDGVRAESAAITMTVGKPALAISQTIPEKHYLGRPLAYEITVTNKGDGPAKNTVMENTIPSAVSSIRATAGAKLSGSRLVWQIGTISVGDSKKVRVSYMPTKEGELASSTSVTAYCADSVTASAKTTVAGIWGLLLEVGDDDPVRVKDRTTYVITVTNQGSAASTNVRIACALEENEQYVSSSGPTAGTLESGTVNFAPLATLAPGAKATWNVVVTAIKAGDVRFKVTMTSDQLTRPVEKTDATHIYE
jgi:uncharacterized repeat protein (TIGR01451 family)